MCRPATQEKSVPEKNCERPDCFVCTSGGKGQDICNKENVTYNISCLENCKKKDIYRGETSYSAYTRGQEHLRKYEKNDPDSMLWNHCLEQHNGRRVKFKMNISGTYHKDAMKRQISEGVEITRTAPQRLMNSKSEWNAPLIPHCVATR